MNQTTNYLIPTLLIALFTLLVGCGDPDRKPLVGVWKIKDPVKVEKRVGEEDSSFDENRMTLEFRGGGKLITSTNMGSIQRQKIGSWKFVSYDAEKKKMEIECVLEGQKTTHTVTFVAENTIKLTPPNMAGLSMQLEFERR